MTIEIRPVHTKQELEVFLSVPWALGMKSDPSWIPSLKDDYRRQFDPKKSPFLKHGELAAFMAFDGGKAVGRISAQVDFDFDQHWGERDPGVATFGFFDSADRPEVAKALLDAASAWAKKKGRKVLRGPYTLDSKGECGVLIDGFGTPPRIGMTHNRPYVGPLLERVGLHKKKDLFAWWFDAKTPLEPLTKKVADRTLSLPNVKVRKMVLKNFRREVDIVRDIYNEAWANNWSFVPFSSEELEIIATEYKMFIDPELALVAEVDGQPAAMCLAVPDLNEMIRDFDGELLRRPWNLVKLLWRNTFNRPKVARLILLGVKQQYRSSRKYGALAAVLYAQVAKNGAAKGYVGGELSWTLEDNVQINRGIERMGAKLYKTYRIYEKEL